VEWESHIQMEVRMEVEEVEEVSPLELQVQQTDLEEEQVLFGLEALLLEQMEQEEVVVEAHKIQVEHQVVMA
jgi:hypothetical protein